MNKADKLIFIYKEIFLTFIVLLYFSNESAGQSQWLDNGKGNSVSIEIYKPFKARDSFALPPGGIIPGFTAFSGAVYLSGRYVISKSFALVGDFPFANGSIDDSIFYTDQGGLKIGNPYLGAEYNIPKSPIMVELGLRLPFTPDTFAEASLAGILSDIDRSEAFIKDIVPVYAAVNYKTVSESNILLKARAGIDVWFNTKKAGFENQPELKADYTLQVGYLHQYVNFLFGLSGRYDMVSGPKLPKKENIIQYGLLVTFPYKNIRPAFSIKVPGSDNLGKVLNYVLGLNFTYGFD